MIPFRRILPVIQTSPRLGELVFSATRGRPGGKGRKGSFPGRGYISLCFFLPLAGDSSQGIKDDFRAQRLEITLARYSACLNGDRGVPRRFFEGYSSSLPRKPRFLQLRRFLELIELDPRQQRLPDVLSPASSVFRVY